MRILNGLEALPAPNRERGSVATVGVFDGVHLGHFLVLRKLVARARERGARAAMVTFANHPKEVVLGAAPPTITSLEHRLLLFRRAGVDEVLVLDFSPELRALTAEEFVRRILLDGLGMVDLVFGFDSKFGRDRGGNPESLAPLAAATGFSMEVVPPLRLDGRAVSSSAIREAVALGDLDKAAVMLGRPVSVLGTVVRGAGRGRDLGWPTANLDLHHELHPPPGVYAALALPDPAGPEADESAADEAARLLPAVVHVGGSPTFGAGGAVEVHLLEGGGDLYGRELEPFFLARLREARRFPDAAALGAQIARDADAARIVTARAGEDWRLPGRYLPIEGVRLEELLAAQGAADAAPRGTGQPEGRSV